MRLEADGERVIEEHYLDSPERSLIYLFHIVTYRFCLPWITGGKVLDYGCGSGYGSHMVAAHCRHITGVDISADAVAYAKHNYHQDNLEFLQISPADAAPLPFDDASFDAVISFQVIEHMADPQAFLAEIRRVLKAGGDFVCATPDRSTRLLPGQKPWNVWHVREYDRAGFSAALGSIFDSVEVFGMGGRPDVLQRELQRATVNKWLTLPFTLPFIPEYLRIRTLHWLKRLHGALSANNERRVWPDAFTEADIFIAADVRPSLNLIAVARKQ